MTASATALALLLPHAKSRMRSAAMIVSIPAVIANRGTSSGESKNRLFAVIVSFASWTTRVRESRAHPGSLNAR